MYKYFIPHFSQSAASSLKCLTEPRNAMLNMISSTLASTTADFIQNKQQCAEYLRTGAYNPKTAFHQKWPLDTSVFSFLNDKWWICSHPLLLQKKKNKKCWSQIHGRQSLLSWYSSSHYSVTKTDFTVLVNDFTFCYNFRAICLFLKQQHIGSVKGHENG